MGFDVSRATFERARAATDGVRALVGELDATLAALYLPEHRHGLSIDAIFVPTVRFFVARIDGRALGCGGIAFYDGFAELKRMYVREEARGSGLAPALLAHLERETLAAGLDVVRLETGDAQHAAMHLYERAGFRRCAAFEPYASLPANSIATSVFFEKRLDDRGPAAPWASE